MDIDQSKVEKLSLGQITIFEPGLEVLFKRNLKEGRLKFTTNLEEAIKDSIVIFLALPTPPGEDGSADLQYVVAAARNIGRYATAPKVIVDKSTVPVGTADKVSAAIREELEKRGQPADLCSVVSNPEFLTK